MIFWQGSVLALRKESHGEALEGHVLTAAHTQNTNTTHTIRRHGHKVTLPRTQREDRPEMSYEWLDIYM